MNKPDLNQCDFVVMNTRSGIAVAAFLIPTDAHRYARQLMERTGPHGPTYEVINADGSSLKGATK